MDENLQRISSDSWVIEYSFQQDTFTVGRLSEYIENSLRAFLDNRPSDTRLIQIFKEEKRCREFSEQLFTLRDKREQLTPHHRIQMLEQATEQIQYSKKTARSRLPRRSARSLAKI